MHPPATYDLLVVGGGINGAGVARDAAGRGLSVALCEQGDFAGATSSASTKLIHGGLRYLEYGEFRLVSEALHEREHLLAIAPHLSRPLRFVMPYAKGVRPRWMIRAGLWLYDRLGGHVSLARSQAVRIDPTTSGLRSDIVQGFAYADAWVDDARLVIANLLDAQRHGAHILARTRLLHAERRDGAWQCVLEDTLTQQKHTLRTRVIVNAAGPWVTQVERMLNPLSQGMHAAIRLVRGSHIVVPKRYEGAHAYLLQNSDRRIVFMIPYEERYTLIGTTEVAQDSMEQGVCVSEEEESYLLHAVNAYLPTPLTHDDIVWRYAGVRPLFDDDAGNPSAVTRDYKLLVDDADGVPCLSIYGGKITTYRRLAEAVLEKLSPWLHTNATTWSTKGQPLPGGDFPRADRDKEIALLQRQYPALPPRLVERLFARHGLLAYDVLNGVKTVEDLGRDFGGGLMWREVEYLVRHEWACEADDILWRRTKCGLHMDEAQRAAFAEYFSECFGNRRLT